MDIKSDTSMPSNLNDEMDSKSVTDISSHTNDEMEVADCLINTLNMVQTDGPIDNWLMIFQVLVK